MKFTWLHVSDLHAGMSDEQYLFPAVRAELFSDLAFLLDKTGPVDLVMFTGDLANRGLQADYVEVEEILGRVCGELKKFGGNVPPLAVVPGNHDLERPKDPGDLAELIAFSENADVQWRFWHEAGNRSRCVVENMFQSYTEWWRATGLLKAPSFKAGVLPGDFSATYEKEGHAIGVVGLNTAFLHVADDLRGKLAVDMRQLAMAIPGDYEDWFARHEFSLLLTHHPEDWFADISRQKFREIRPPGRFAAHLFGHLHEGSATTFRYGSGGKGTLNLFQAPSLFGLEQYGTRDERSHGFCVGQIDLEEKSLVFWPRRATRTQAGNWDFGADVGVGLPKGVEHTDPIPLDSTAGSPSTPAKLRIESIAEAGRQRDELRCAIQIYNERLPAEERYDESILVDLIRHHLSGDFGANRPSAYWKAHLLVSKYGAEVVGMLLGYDDLSASISFVSYLVAKPPRPDVVNEDVISEELLREFLRIHEQDGEARKLRYLTEVDDPTRTDDPTERLRRLARIALFDRFAAYAGIELRVLDLTFLQPKLDPWAGDAPEKELMLLYAAESVPASLSKTEALEILTWSYTQLYAANMFDDPADFERYMAYVRSLLERVANKLPDRVELLRVQKLKGRLLSK